MDRNIRFQNEGVEIRDVSDEAGSSIEQAVMQFALMQFKECQVGQCAAYAVGRSSTLIQPSCRSSNCLYASITCDSGSSCHHWTLACKEGYPNISARGRTGHTELSR